jgi:hypothetical protein
VVLGGNTFGQLGYPLDLTNLYVGDEIEDMGDNLVGVSLEGRAVALLSGGAHVCALLDDGSTQCWGDNGVGQLAFATL